MISKCEIAEYQNVSGFKIKFKVFENNKIVETPVVANANEMRFNFNHIVSYKSLTPSHLNFFETGCVTFVIYAVQREVQPKNRVLGLSTRVKNKILIN